MSEYSVEQAVRKTLYNLHKTGVALDEIRPALTGKNPYNAKTQGRDRLAWGRLAEKQLAFYKVGPDAWVRFCGVRG